jgi:hypothetical protein
MYIIYSDIDRSVRRWWKLGGMEMDTDTDTDTSMPMAMAARTNVVTVMAMSTAAATAHMPEVHCIPIQPLYSLNRPHTDLIEP